MAVETEVRVMWSQAKNAWSPRAGRGRKSLPQSHQSERGPAHTLISDSWLPALSEKAVGIYLGRPRSRGSGWGVCRSDGRAGTVPQISFSQGEKSLHSGDTC